MVYSIYHILLCIHYMVYTTWYILHGVYYMVCNIRLSPRRLNIPITSVSLITKDTSIVPSLSSTRFLAHSLYRAFKTARPVVEPVTNVPVRWRDPGSNLGRVDTFFVKLASAVESATA